MNGPEPHGRHEARDETGFPVLPNQGPHAQRSDGRPGRHHPDTEENRNA